MKREDQVILSLLNAVSEDSHTTQNDLATRLGIGVGLVNSYLKRVIYKGYIKTKQMERRRLLYLLTPRGIKEKARLTYEFLEYSYQYIGQIRSKVYELLKPFGVQQKKRVVFYGSGEVAEVAFLASREARVELVAIIDPDRAGTRCVDFPVYGADWFGQDNPFDVLLILSPEGAKVIAPYQEKIPGDVVVLSISD